MERLDILAAVIQEEHGEIFRDWKERVRKLPRLRNLDRLSLEDGFRAFLDGLTNALLVYHDTKQVPEVSAAPAEHGRQRFQLGIDIAQVVAEYNMLRHALQDCADRHHISLDGAAGHVVHEVIDTAVASAVESYAGAQAAEHEARIQEKLSYVVHDLKTPLSAVHTAVHLLEGRLSPESKKNVGTMLSIIFRNCENLNTLLMRLLERNASDEMVLHSEVNRIDVPLRVLADEIVESVRPLAQKTGVPVLNEVPDRLQVSSDPFLLKQLLQNLVSNALKYTETGRITIGGARIDHQAQIWVEDTGVGIPPEKIPRLFTSAGGDPLKPGSTGIGLSIVKKIVDAHQGEITVESKPGKGTLFTVTLPL